MLGNVLEIRDEPDTMRFADCGGTVNKVYVQKESSASLCLINNILYQCCL